MSTCTEKCKYGSHFLQNTTTHTDCLSPISDSFSRPFPASNNTGSKQNSCHGAASKANEREYRCKRQAQGGGINTDNAIKKLKRAIKTRTDQACTPMASISTSPFSAAESLKSRKELAETLSTLSDYQKDRYAPISWANKFYAVNMKYILEQNEHAKTNSRRRQDISTVTGINKAAALKCQLGTDAVCCCGVVTYNMFASNSGTPSIS